MPVEPKLPPAYVTMMSMVGGKAAGPATKILERVLSVHRPERASGDRRLGIIWLCSTCSDGQGGLELWSYCKTMIAVADELGVRLTM